MGIYKLKKLFRKILWQFSITERFCWLAGVIEEVSSKPFGVDPQVMMSIIKGLYSLKPG